MSRNRFLLVASREYLERVRTKAFWISTLLVPAAMVGFVALPSMLGDRAGSSGVRLAVVDRTGAAGAGLENAIETWQKSNAARHGGAGAPGEPSGLDERKSREESMKLRVSVTVFPADADIERTYDNLDRRTASKEFDSYVVIPPEALERPAALEYHSRVVGSIGAMDQIEKALNQHLSDLRLRRSGIDPVRVAELAQSPSFKTVSVPRGETRRDLRTALIQTMSVVMTVYMMLIFYGTFVMRGVLEEKTSRVVEVIVSSVRPFDLMFGKIFGIGMVGLTQVGLWSIVAVNLSLPVVVGVVGGGFPAIPPLLLLSFVGYFVLGFFLYATLFAGVGAAFDTEQDAQQFATVVIMLLVVPMMFLNVVLVNPSGVTSTILSLVPFFSPVLMLMRIALEPPPAWQIALSGVLMVATTLVMTGLVARVYRVGILMYGKKPTIPEIIRWVTSSRT